MLVQKILSPTTRSARPRHRLRLNWEDEQGPEVPDSHDERLARVWRQLQCDNVLHRRDALVSARPAQADATDRDDSSYDFCIVEQQQTTRRQGRTVGSGTQVPWFTNLNQGLRSLDCVSLVNVFDVRPIVMKTPFFVGHFHDCVDNFTRDSTWSTQPGSHN